MSVLLDKMQANLERMEEGFSAHLAADDRLGHMGTPFVDNSKGRRMRKVAERHDERSRRFSEQIKEQREKIDRQKIREALRATQTKKSAVFIAKNPISPALFKLQEMGKVKQWARNPQYFFVIGMERVALTTVGGKTRISTRFPARNQADFEHCKALLKEAA